MDARRLPYKDIATSELRASYRRDCQAYKKLHEQCDAKRAELVARQALEDKRAELAKLTAEVEAAEAAAKGAAS